MELGGIPSKIDEYFHWGPIFYVCSFASNRVPFMFNYYIRNSLWVAAILDISSSQTGTFQQKNSSLEMINFFLYCIKKNEFFKLTEGYPPRPVSENYEKTILQWKPMELGGIPSKIDEYFHWGHIFYVCSFARNRVPFMYDYYIRNSLWVEAILDIWSS